MTSRNLFVSSFIAFIAVFGGRAHAAVDAAVVQGIAATSYVDRLTENKQDKLTAGVGIDVDKLDAKEVAVKYNVMQGLGTDSANSLVVSTGDGITFDDNGAVSVDIQKSSGYSGSEMSALVGGAQPATNYDDRVPSMGLVAKMAQAGVDQQLVATSTNAISNKAVTEKFNSIDSALDGKQNVDGYTQSADVVYANISSGSQGDGGQYPSLAAAKKIAQEAVKNELKAGNGLGFSSDGKLQVNAGNGLEFQDNGKDGISVKVFDGAGLGFADDGGLDVVPAIATVDGSQGTIGGIIPVEGSGWMYDSSTGQLSLSVMAEWNSALENWPEQAKKVLVSYRTADQLAEKKANAVFGKIPVGSATSSTKATIWVE